MRCLGSSLGRLCAWQSLTCCLSKSLEHIFWSMCIIWHQYCHTGFGIMMKDVLDLFHHWYNHWLSYLALSSVTSCCAAPEISTLHKSPTRLGTLLFPLGHKFLCCGFLGKWQEFSFPMTFHTKIYIYFVHFQKRGVMALI